MFLEKIIARKRAEVIQLKKNVTAEKIRSIAENAPDPRGFLGALSSKDGPRIIAEIKKASPSKGLLAENMDIVSQAQIYERHGAAAISVLTDFHFFKGSCEDLEKVRKNVELPVLRKDFILDPIQIYESRAIGADAILLIATILSMKELENLTNIADEIGLDVLIEVHSPKEVNEVLDLKPKMIGINNRDLVSFEVKISNSLMMLPIIPEDVLVVSESGIGTPADIAALKTAGINAFLIGEALVRSPDPGKKLASLLNAGKNGDTLELIEPDPFQECHGREEISCC